MAIDSSVLRRASQALQQAKTSGADVNLVLAFEALLEWAKAIEKSPALKATKPPVGRL